MGTIAEKLAYLSDAVDDIQAAINEKGIDVDDSVALGKYGTKIRAIISQNGWLMKDYITVQGTEYDIEADIITGANVEDVTDSITVTENTYDTL